MDKLSKDELLLDIENLFHDSAITSTNQEITQAVNRLDAILDLILKSTNNSKQLKYLFDQLDSLKNLNEFYQKLKETTEAAKPKEVKYVEFLLIRRLNGFNAKLNIVCSNILFKNPQFNTANQTESLICILNDYEYSQNFTYISRSKAETSKLIIKSIFLEDNSSVQLTSGCDYLCSVYQFENNEYFKTDKTKNQFVSRSDSSNQQLRQPRSKSQSKNSGNSITKRSSSADLNTIKNRRAKADMTEKLEELNMKIDCSVTSTKPSLNQKCLAVNSFKFKHTKNEHSLELNHLISLKPACKYLIIVVYKLIKPTNDQSDSYYKLPIKYVQLNEHHLKNPACPLIQNVKMPLSPIIENCSAITISTLPRQVLMDQDSELSSNSSVFKRMFKRSKSTNRPRNGLSFKNEESSGEYNCGSETNKNSTNLKKLTIRNLISFDLTYDQSDLVATDFTIENFSKWQSIWHPSLPQEKVSSSPNKNFETLTIYLNDLKQVSVSYKDVSQQEPLTTSSFYFIEIQMINTKQNDKICYFHSSLFQLNDRVNDLCQIPLEYDHNTSLKFFVFKLGSVTSDKSKAVQLGVSNLIDVVDRRNLENMSDIDLFTGNNKRIYNLKFRCSYESEYYPKSKSQNVVDLFNFKLLNKAESEKELLDLIEEFNNKKIGFDESILIRKFLEFFAVLNTAFPNDDLIAGRKNERRLIKSLLLVKIYQGFIQVVEKCFYSKTRILELDINILLSNLSNQLSRQCVHFLLNFLKNQIDTLDTCQFAATMKCFNKLIEIIYILSLGNSNKSKFEIKYELNDLIVKLFGVKSQSYQNPEKRSITSQNLNLDFIDTISSLFSGIELTTLVTTNFILLPEPNIVFSYLNNIILHLDYFKSNHQFRDSLVAQLLKHSPLFKPPSSSQILDNNQLDFITCLLAYRSCLSKHNLDTLVQLTLKLLIHSMINHLRLTTSINDKEISLTDNFLVRNFVCLIEMLDIILMDRSTKNSSSLFTTESNHKTELNNIFEIIIFFFKSDKFRATIFECERSKLWRTTNQVILKFAKYIQKQLQRYLITFEEVNVSQETSTISSCKTSNDFLIRNYIEMIFVFIDTNCSSFSLDISMKHEMLQTLHLFWKCLNISLKRSVSLNEFILKRLCNSFIVNLYFKILETSQLAIETDRVLQMSPFLNRNSSVLFYESIFRFFNDLFSINQGASLKSFKQFLLIMLVKSVVRREKIIRKSKSCNSNVYKNFSLLIFDGLKDSMLVDGQSLYQTVKLCGDFNMLKDEISAVTGVSIIEKFLITYELIKQVDEVEVNNRFFSNEQYLFETKRNIKMFLLDDLYFLHKLERNRFHMSFVRKEQADLLDCNNSRKSSHESDLKEILYLKSLKKSALNTLNDHSDSTSSLSSCKASSTRSPYLSSSQSSISSDSSSASPTSSPSSSSASPISTPSSLSLANSLKLDPTHPNSFLTTIQTEICKQLQTYYQKLDETTFPKITRILNAEAKILQIDQVTASANLSQEAEDDYNRQGYYLSFRVGLFGSALQLDSINNKHFLYKHTTYEMVKHIQSLMLAKISNSIDWQDQTLSLDSATSPSKTYKTELLRHNQVPSMDVKNSKDTCHIQVCAVKRIENYKLVELIDELPETKETINMMNWLAKHDKNEKFYYFDRPVNVKQDVVCVDSVENLWVERSLLLLDENAGKFENLCQYEEIKSVFKIMMNPIRNAINDINVKIKDLSNFIVEFRANSSQQISRLSVIHNLQPLTMKLMGCLLAGVNGGLIKYVKELFSHGLAASKQFRKKSYLMNQLYLSFKEMLEVLDNALGIHERDLYKVGEPPVSNNSENERDSFMEDLKHMNQLNDHFKECLKLVNRELNEQWAKFSMVYNNRQLN